MIYYSVLNGKNCGDTPSARLNDVQPLLSQRSYLQNLTNTRTSYKINNKTLKEIDSFSNDNNLKNFKQEK